MFPYQNLEVYKKSFIFNKEIYKLINSKSNIPSFYKNQIGRASLSIMLNIAEGSGRFTNKDRKSFFIIARSSVFECASLVDFLSQNEQIAPETRKRYDEVLEEISKILFKMIKSLE